MLVPLGDKSHSVPDHNDARQNWDLPAYVGQDVSPLARNVSVESPSPVIIRRSSGLALSSCRTRGPADCRIALVCPTSALRAPGPAATQLSISRIAVVAPRNGARTSQGCGASRREAVEQWQDLFRSDAESPNPLCEPFGYHYLAQLLVDPTPRPARWRIDRYKPSRDFRISSKTTRPGVRSMSKKSPRWWSAGAETATQRGPKLIS